MKNFIVDTSDTYFLSTLYKDVDILIDLYGDILKKEVIGYSVCNNEILALKLSNSNSLLDSKAKLLLVGGIHAREDFSVMLCMKMLENYCYYYKNNIIIDNFDLKNILNKVDIYFIPIANPDGLNIVHHGIKSSCNYENLKNMRIWGDDHTYWKANANGVDLNKNFDDGNWDIRLCVEGTDKPCSDRFKGFYPNSEPETNILINYCNNNNFSLMVSYHCSGNCTFWADSKTHHIFRGIDENIMDEFAQKYIYRKTKISEDPKIFGCGFENWFRKIKKRPAFCIELSPYIEGGKQHPDYMFDDLVWQYAKNTGLFFALKALEINNEIFNDSDNNDINSNCKLKNIDTTNNILTHIALTEIKF